MLGKNTILILFVIVGLASCKDDGTSTDMAPEISFNSIDLIKTSDGFDSLMYIRFDFSDVNGDLGLRDGDTTGDFRGFNDLEIEFDEKLNGMYQPLKNRFTGNPANYHQRIPNLTPTGKNKEISGTISVLFEVNANEIYADTVAFRLRIFDRNFNPSNEISQTDIALNQR